ncbi:MAG: serine hydrolase, partial [Planctomycetota bacterium]|nr:serine hydrolase [Planctomycetota bacterium]
MRCGFLSLLFASLTFWISSASACLGADPLEGLDDFINQAMAKHEVPGLAIAIVKDGQVVVAKGYGVRELGKPELVDADTIFAIASCTKAFTATAIGSLVDEGKMKWDDKVIDHLPEFKLYDPYVTREITIRDLLTHRCGLDRHDLIWFQSPHSRTEVLRRVARAKPDSSFRSKFSYNNIMYLAAGEAVGRAAGVEWEALIEERMFKPLGMTRSTTSVRTLPEQTDVATPHERVHDVVAPI